MVKIEHIGAAGGMVSLLGAFVTSFAPLLFTEYGYQLFLLGVGTVITGFAMIIWSLVRQRNRRRS